MIASIGVVVVSIAADVTAVLASQGNSPPGTIVVQRFAFHSRGTRSVSEMTITDTSATGRVERLVETVSFAPGLETEDGRDSISAYVARDNTIYAMTDSSIRALEVRRNRRFVSLRRPVAAYATGTMAAPGATSYFKRLLDTDFYRVAGRTKVGRRPALKLVPESAKRERQRLRNPKLEFAGTAAYVAPRTYAPIKDVVTQPGGPSITIVWKRYKVLRATRTDERLLSLRARHPTARISHSPAAYLRATAHLRKKHTHG